MNWTDVSQHIELLADSFERVVGRPLLAGAGEDRAKAIHEAPFVLVSHGTESDPVLNYGNRCALELWEMSWEALTSTPSRLTAEPGRREDRERMMNSVRNNGFVENYTAVRISHSGRRFRIEETVVWNVLTKDDMLCGQAAMFPRWTFL